MLWGASGSDWADALAVDLSTASAKLLRRAGVARRGSCCVWLFRMGKFAGWFCFLTGIRAGKLAWVALRMFVLP